jgi:4-aminobutyrate aminotransferase
MFNLFKKSNYLDRDKKFISPALARAHDLVAIRASGSYIYDENDNAYLDFTSGIAVNQVGHAHPEVAQAIAEQAAKCIHTSCVVHYPANIELAEKLASILPGDLSLSFFSNSGAEAIDGAIKLAKLVKNGRNNIISHKGGFHGRTIGGTSLTTSKSAYRKYYDPLLPCVHTVDFPNSYKFSSLEERKIFETEKMEIELKRLLDTAVHPESIAAIFIEPVLGEGGYIPAPKEFKNYLKVLRELCDKHGILLVFDEVQSGIGRTGKWFACEHYEVVPDIITLAKGLSGGMPLGAFVSRPEIMSQMPPGSHGSTFGGNPVCCMASLKLLEIMERDKVLDNVKERSKQIFDYFEKRFPGSNSNLYGEKANPKIRVRGLGLMIGLEFTNAEAVNKIKAHAYKNKLLLLGCGTYSNVIRLAPDLTISEQDTEKALNIIADATEKL